MSIDKSKTSFLTSGSNGGVSDEYYINEIIGLDELMYEDYVDDGVTTPHLRTNKHQLELFPRDVEVKCKN
jgi:hypothetical protein